MSDELAKQLEAMRSRMTTGFVSAHQHLYAVEDAIEQEKQGVLRHLQDVQRRLDEARHEVAQEIERASTAMWGGPPPVPAPAGVPTLEERFSPPRMLRGAAE